jgi:hypothetical protein
MGDFYGACSNEEQLGSLQNVNLNTLNDQTITLAEGNKRITRIIVADATGTTATAAGGIYTGINKTGNTVVAAAQTYAALTAAKTLSLTVDKDYVTGNQVYLSLTTAEGAASTCDVYVYGEVLSL